ncbi:MAG: site-specific DNA-methyltransferase [Thermodesulfovibrionia bacterium]|nr:site-specific DNA-methyltransferase [Thermodesulfovibrionia bacterium]
MPNENIRKKDSARLAWDSKPRRAPNPKDIEFQTAEVVIPNPAHREQLPLSFRDGKLGEAEIDKQKMSRLIWGDNLLAMQALLTQGYEGKINLIYIDPPFDSKADYSHKMTINNNPTLEKGGKGGFEQGLEFTKEPSVIERLAYKDTWAGGTDSYLDMLYPRLQLMKRLLAEDGSIYVHLDWHVGHYVKIMMDEVFGRENFINEIVWQKIRVTKGQSIGFGNVHDNIFIYRKSSKAAFNQQKRDFDPKYINSHYRKEPETGRLYRTVSFVQKGQGQARYFGDKLLEPPSGMHWIWSQEKIDKAMKESRIKFTSKGTPEKVQYLDEMEGDIVDDLWADIYPVNSQALEDTNYSTQKPSALLERIIEASSNEGDLVADFFCGSGTTLAVAEKLNRRWIGCELGKVGIQVTRARLVEQQARPFLIENIGNYQREMIYLTGGRIYEMQHLILKLYGATPRDKMSGLGIRKAEDNVDELVYVGYPDRPVTAGKAEELALQAQKLDGRGYKRLIILGWDYEYNYHQALESRKSALKDKIKVEIISRDIPPDIYDYLKKAKTDEDIEALSEKVKFYERPYLKMNEPKIKDLKDGKAEITLAIKRYVLMDIPISQTSKKGQEDYTALMKIAKDNFAVLIDYWAIDWDYDGFTFKSQWQSFRGNGKKAKTVITETKETLEKKKRIIAVRVVDIFGNDAGAVMEV